MNDDQHWKVRKVDRSELATGGLVSPGHAVMIFPGDCIIPKRLAEIIGNPFEEEDVD